MTAEFLGCHEDTKMDFAVNIFLRTRFRCVPAGATRSPFMVAREPRVTCIGKARGIS
jgi:hypothetical protein